VDLPADRSLGRDPHDLLSDRAKKALAEARRTPLSYAVRMYACPGPRRRILVVLGEAHIKLAPAEALGREVVGSFELRGVETFQRKRVFAGRLLGHLIHVPRLVLRALTLGFVKGSTITEAKQLPSGATVELERTKAIPMGLHAASLYLTVFFSLAFFHIALTALASWFPDLGIGGSALLAWTTLAMLALQAHMILLVPAYALRRERWAWLVHPAIGLVSSRDMLMAEGTVRMFEDHPQYDAAVTVMGRAHLRGYERELVDKHGFKRIDG